MRLLKISCFGSLAVVIMMMAAATVLEKIYGTEVAFRTFYHSFAFIGLWSVIILTGAMYLWRSGVWHHVPTFLIHVAFVLILIGALVTHLCAQTGELHLRENGQSADSFTAQSGVEQILPFTVALNDFSIKYYRGSQAPMDFISNVTVTDGDKKLQAQIVMNHILKYRGYRFYQKNFDVDERGSVLTVTHDPWGVAITYSGYVMLLMAMLAFFFQKKSRFREALRRLSVIVAVLLLCNVPLSAAQARQSKPKVLPRDVAAEFGRLHVYYNDRIAPLQTLARDYVMKIYGKPSVYGYTAEQVFTGWLFFYNSWMDVPIKLKAKDRGTLREKEKLYILQTVRTTEVLKIFPYVDTVGMVTWYAPNDNLPPELSEEQWMFFKRVLSLIGESIYQGDYGRVNEVVQTLGRYQQKTAGIVLPTPAKIGAERLYNALDRTRPISLFCMTLGVMLFVWFAVNLSRHHRDKPWIRISGAIIATLIGLWLTLLLVLRWVVSSHIPMANGFEMMLLIAWLAMLLGAFGKRLPLILPFAFILGGFALLVATLGESNPQITPLMPVLSSPLLSMHVTCMMLSYTLLGLLALNGMMGLVVMQHETIGKLRDMGMVVLYPAVFLLAVGIFLGAVWANVSWGSYWAWDPKETWALITLLVYAAPFHTRSLPCLDRPRCFHAFCVIAFVTVLITYFGVNFILGGMHSYA